MSENAGGGGRSAAGAVPMNSGNPRVTVAFPFSKITIGGAGTELAELAGVVTGLADQLALVCQHLEVGDVEEVERLVDVAHDLHARLARP